MSKENSIGPLETQSKASRLIFQDELVFDPTYTPEMICHREKELTILSQLFLSLITAPNSVSRKIMITGPLHTGKTKTILLFTKMLTCAGRKRGVNFYTPYISCRNHNTPEKILTELYTQVPSQKKRVNSRTRDLFRNPKTYKQRIPHFVIILDDIEFFRGDWDTLLDAISSRLLWNKNATRISYIAILSNEIFLQFMPIKHNLKLIKNMIRFSQFDTYQVFDILKYRASLGFKPGVFTDGHIRMVADNAIKRCEGVTYGIKVLHWAGKLAQENHRSFIRYDDIRRAIIFTGAMWIG